MRRIGRPDTGRDVLEALMLDRGLRRFDPWSSARRATAPPDVPRRDLRALPTFTIDPPTARDFDDAISAEALDDGLVRVWVHIADVAAHVRPGSHVDREAFKRGTSVYVPGLWSRCCRRRSPTRRARWSRTRTGWRSPSSSTWTGDGPRSAFHRSVIRPTSG